MMVCCNIPLNNLDAPEFKAFLERYTKETVVSRRTASRSYIPSLYDAMLTKIRNAIANHYIWFSFDETTDTKGRYIANFVVGILNGSPSDSYLVAVKQLEKTNNLTISRFVNETLSLLYLPQSVPSEKILYMVTDGAAYMHKAAQNLKIFYPNLVHTTCLAHAMNRVAEAIRIEFPVVNSLINSGKKFFLKAPTRIQVYREHLKDVPLPPQPILTRWGTWIEAALFYCENYNSFKDIVNSFDATSAQSVSDCQTTLQNRELMSQLSYIKSHFSDIPVIIKKLEERNLLLTESLSLIENFRDSVNKNKSEICKKVSTKLTDSLKKNTGFLILKTINNILQGNFSDEGIDENVAIQKSHLFKYCPVTSCDTERNFSMYKNLLHDNRQRFLVDNLEKHMIIYCNK